MKKIISILLVLMMVFVVGCQSQQTQSETPKVEETNANEEATTTSDALTIADALAGNYQLIDARASHAFNGWTLNDETKGGHLKGAKLFSATWTSKMKDEEVTEYLNLQGIDKNTMLAVYGYNQDKDTLVAFLKERGYQAVAIEEPFNTIVEGDVEVMALPNYEVLVPASYVKNIIDGSIPTELEGKEIKIFEASWGPGDEYAKAHIPTAVHINTDEVEVGPLWNRVDDNQLMEMLKANGVTKDTVVILYSTDTTPPARVGMLMKYLGVEDVRLLDGGFQSWQEAGYQVDKGMVEKSPVTETGLDAVVNPSYVIDLEEAKAMLADEKSDLVSIRSWEEFLGTTSGYDYIEAAGRIDGAKYGYAGLNPWNMADYRTPDNTMIDYDFMVKRWSDMGITADNANSFYCGTGWRASEVWFYAYALGWDNISVYDGGWKEWSEAGEASATGLPESGTPAGK